MAVDQPADSKGMTGLQKFAVAIVAIAAISLAVFGAATSYISVRNMAIAHHVPFPRLNPIGIDGGLLTVVALDIVLTWIGYSLKVLRLLARLFALATVAANAMSGWPDGIAVALHITPSVLLVIVIEGVRAVLLSGQEEQKAKTKRATAGPQQIDPIPRMRWLLAPFRTFGLWRRMVLWHVPSYLHAVDLELSRRQAVVRLKAHFGPEWKRKAPNDLVWMLRSGVRIAEACARVELIIAPKPISRDTSETPAGSHTRSPGRARGRRDRTTPPPARNGAVRRPAIAENGTGAEPQNGAPNGAQNGPGTHGPTGPQNGAGSQPQNGPQNGPAPHPQTAAGAHPQNGTGPQAENGAGTAARRGLVSVSGPATADRSTVIDDPTDDAELMARARTIFAAFKSEHGQAPTLDQFTPLLGRARTVASRVRRALLDEVNDHAEAVAQ